MFRYTFFLTFLDYSENDIFLVKCFFGLGNFRFIIKNIYLLLKIKHHILVYRVIITLWAYLIEKAVTKSGQCMYTNTFRQRHVFRESGCSRFGPNHLINGCTSFSIQLFDAAIIEEKYLPSEAERVSIYIHTRRLGSRSRRCMSI